MRPGNPSKAEGETDVQVLSFWGGRGAAYCLVAGPRLSALAPAAVGNSTHLHQRREDRVLADANCIFRVSLDEEITEDFLFSLNLFPPLPLFLQDRFSVTTRGVRTRRAVGAGEPRSRTAHLRLVGSGQIESTPPPPEASPSAPPECGAPDPDPGPRGLAQERSIFAHGSKHGPKPGPSLKVSNSKVLTE